MEAQDARDELLAEPWYAKKELDHHRTGDDPSDQRAQDGGNRDEGIPQRMAKDHDPSAEALGPGGPHVVLPDHLEHAGPGQPGDDGGRGQGGRNRRDRDLFGVAPTDVLVDLPTSPGVEAGDREQDEQ